MSHLGVYDHPGGVKKRVPVHIILLQLYNTYLMNNRDNELLSNCPTLGFCFVLFWLRWVFVAARRLSLVSASGGYSSLQCTGISLWWWLLLLRSTGSRCAGFSSCGTRAQQLWHTGLVPQWHVGSSWTRARTRVPCISRRILNHCATREAPLWFLKNN